MLCLCLISALQPCEHCFAHILTPVLNPERRASYGRHASQSRASASCNWSFRGGCPAHIPYSSAVAVGQTPGRTAEKATAMIRE
jgi:hypothetical protein